MLHSAYVRQCVKYKSKLTSVNFPEFHFPVGAAAGKVLPRRTPLERVHFTIMCFLTGHRTENTTFKVKGGV